MDWRYFSYAQSHPGKVRAYNEDALLDCPDSGVWVVADGMGGHQAGDVASQMLVDIVQQHIRTVPSSMISVDLLHNALHDANRQIFDYSERYMEGETVGTTAVVLFIQNGEYHCLWVGDSRMYMLRQQQLIQCSRDHSQVMEMVEQGLLAAEEAENHPLANVITRAIGVNDDVLVDHVSGPLMLGDQFLLCSDGLTKELTDQHLAHCLQANSLSDSGLALMHSALVRGASDNVTCILVRATCLETDAKERLSTPVNDATVPVFRG
ncbi:protein phosphatase 2C domain-containing protein [Photobacterium japonica]|uniref:PP2C family protein-serine/threonine phosphatase n=1 Tax=Photobacterium japonica TaxID=2910235 RepID=UPI003D0F29BA